MHFVFWSSKFSVAITKQLPKATWERKGLCQFTDYSLLLLEVKVETQGQNLETGIEADATEKHCLLDCFCIPYSAWFLMQPRTNCSGVALSTMGWALPHQSSVKKISPSFAHRPMWWRKFFNQVSVFTGELNFYQLDSHYLQKSSMLRISTLENSICIDKC